MPVRLVNWGITHCDGLVKSGAHTQAVGSDGPERVNRHHFRWGRATDMAR